MGSPSKRCAAMMARQARFVGMHDIQHRPIRCKEHSRIPPNDIFHARTLLRLKNPVVDILQNLFSFHLQISYIQLRDRRLWVPAVRWRSVIIAIEQQSSLTSPSNK